MMLYMLFMFRSRRLFCELIQQACEKIDRTRTHAGEIFAKLLYHRFLFVFSWIFCFYYTAVKKIEPLLYFQITSTYIDQYWCLAEGQWNGDQRRPMGHKAREGLYSLSLSIGQYQ